MNKIGFENFRSFDDTGFIDIKPLTIFVGTNSSGKSSILRSFPLIKESLRLKPIGPILWSNDQVDFGSFEEVKKRDSSKNEIILKFSTKVAINRNSFLYRQSFSDYPSNDSVHESKIYVKIMKNNDKEYISSVLIEIYDHSIEIKYNDNYKKKDESEKKNNYNYNYYIYIIKIFF